jgi:carbamoyltransferase
MTQRCFLKPNEEEYILMGMAAYGNPDRLYDRIRNDFFNDNSNKLVALKGNLHRGCQSWAPDLTVNDIFDIAAATQRIYESYFDKIISKAKALTGSVNLVIMGGCALNCSANPIAFKHFKNVWIMPNPGDAGSSIGAVLAKTKTPMSWTGCDLGYNLKIKTAPDEIVDHLLSDSMCGVAQGRAEFGPRAFGNRSLLADPRGNNIKDTVNAIKRRQQFRPFAPVILEEHADNYFDLCGSSSDHRYMQYISRCRHPQLFPAIIHRDGTSRVQTVPQNGTHIRRLLEAWYDRTGCPMLLNTSLNIKGKPMVNNRADAMNFESHYNVKVFT